MSVMTGSEAGEFFVIADFLRSCLVNHRLYVCEGCGNWRPYSFFRSGYSASTASNKYSTSVADAYRDSSKMFYILTDSVGADTLRYVHHRMSLIHLHILGAYLTPSLSSLRLWRYSFGFTEPLYVYIVSDASAVPYWCFWQIGGVLHVLVTTWRIKLVNLPAFWSELMSCCPLSNFAKRLCCISVPSAIF